MKFAFIQANVYINYKSYITSDPLWPTQSYKFRYFQPNWATSRPKLRKN